MKLNEKINVTGTFRMKVYENGILVADFTDHNLVVNNGRNAIAELLGNTGPGRYITDISFGDVGTPPTSLDTTIGHPFTKPITSVSYPGTGVAQFDWSLELAEDNGVTIQEFGLRCADGSLFARKTGYTIVKTSTVRLEGTWSINF